MKKLFLITFFVSSIAFSQVTDTGDKVGIGTATPSEKLDVNGNIKVQNGGEVLANGTSILTLGNTNGGLVSIGGDPGTSELTGKNNHLKLRTTRDQDDMFFSTGTLSTNRMIIKGGTGNVGIGTTSPSSVFHVEKYSNTTTPLAIFEGSTNDTPQVIIKNSGGSGEGLLIQAGGTGSSNAFNVSRHNGEELMVVQSNGKVGIGTSSPNAQLHLYSNNGTEYNTFFDTNSMNFDTPSNTPSYINKKDTGSLRFRMGATYNTVMTVNNNGNVGIGSSDPKEKLHLLESNKNDINLTLEQSNEGTHDPKLSGTSGITQQRFNPSLGNYRGELTIQAQDYNNGYYMKNIATFLGNGDVGIGTTTPSSLLTLNSESGSVITLQHNNLTKSSIIGELDGASGGNLEFWTREDGGSNTQKMVIKPNGNVGIGTATPDAKLAVNGNIHTKEVKVDLIGWSDFVFKSDYKLPTLKEVEQHIKDNGHLQDIPSAEEVAKNGFFLGEMDSKLLQKIEELTLYTIQQEKEIEVQNNKIETLERENTVLQSLSKRLADIEKLLKAQKE